MREFGTVLDDVPSTLPNELFEQSARWWAVHVPTIGVSLAFRDGCPGSMAKGIEMATERHANGCG